MQMLLSAWHVLLSICERVVFRVVSGDEGWVYTVVNRKFGLEFSMAVYSV